MNNVIELVDSTTSCARIYIFCHFYYSMLALEWPGDCAESLLDSSQWGEFLVDVQQACAVNLVMCLLVESGYLLCVLRSRGKHYCTQCQLHLWS